jgi:hypothetical protein
MASSTATSSMRKLIPTQALTNPEKYVAESTPETLASVFTKTGHNLAWVLAIRFKQQQTTKLTNALFDLSKKCPSLFVSLNEAVKSVLSAYPNILVNTCFNQTQFVLDKRPKPRITEEQGENLGCQIEYSKGLSVLYLRPDNYNGQMRDFLITNKTMPEESTPFVATALAVIEPKDASFSGLHGLLNFVMAYLKTNNLNVSFFNEVAYFPGCSTLQELPLFRAFFPEVKVVGTDPFLSSIDDVPTQTECLKNINNVIEKDGNAEFFGKSATEKTVPENAQIIFIRHPHLDDMDSCWKSVFNQIAESNFSLFVMTHYHKFEMDEFYQQLRTAFNVEPEPQEDTASSWQKKGFFLHQGISPGALPFFVANGEPDSGVDLYHSVLMRNPRFQQQIAT